MGLLAAGIGSLQYVLDQGQQKDWFEDGWITAFAATAVAGLVSFVVWELRRAKPVVDLHVLRYRSVAAGSILGLALGVSLYGSVLILPQYVQNSLGFTATLSGELLIMRAGAVMLLTPLAAALAARGKVDPRLFIACGFLLLGISNLMLASITTPQTQFWTFFWSLALSGLGLSQIFVPLSISVLGSVKPKDIPAASAFFNLSRQIGGSIAIALLITILVRADARHHTELASGVTLSSPPVAQYVQQHGGAQASAGTLNTLVDQQSIVLAYADTARATAVLTLLLVPCVLLMRRPRPHAAPAAE